MRNLHDLVELERLESEYDVPFISISQPTDKNPAGRMMRRTLANMASFYTEQQSLDVRDGMNRRVAEGWFPSRAPYGYRNVRTDGRSVIVVDEQEAAHVRRMFELAATDSWTLDGIIDRLYAEGRVYRPKKSTFCRSNVHKILTNLAYCGLIPYKGTFYEGKYPPLVTKMVFDRVQAIIRRKTKPHKKELKPYLYRGMFRCGGCGCVITTETQKGHHYLRCTRKVKRDCRNPFMREEIVTNRISDILRSVALAAEDADWMLQELEREQNHDEAGARADRDRLSASLAEVHQKLERLAELYVSEGIKMDEYASLRNRLLSDKHRLKEQIDTLRHNPGARLEPIIRFISDAKKAGILAEAGTAEEQRDLFKKTGSNLQLLNRELRWEPRHAWQIVHETLADQGCFAHNESAAPMRGAAACRGETSLSLTCPTKWTVPMEARMELLSRFKDFFRSNPGWE